MKRAIPFILWAIFNIAFILPCQGKKETDTAFHSLLKQYTEAYNAPGMEQQFFQLSNLIKEHYLKEKDYNNYYVIRLNQALYKSEHGKVYEAIKEANEMMSDMKSRNINQYEKVFLALGTIYEGRGNIRMAEHYYLEALKHVKPSDQFMLINTYTRLAYLNMFVQPEKAASWIEKSRNITESYPYFIQENYFIEAGIDFYQNKRQEFNSAYQKYQEYREQHQEKYGDYGLYTLQLMKKAIDGDYEKALEMTPLAVEKNELNNTMELDLRSKIFEMKGDMKEVITMLQKRRSYRDSLNSDMLFNNINEINAQLNMYELKQESAKRITLMSFIIIALSFITIIILVFWVLRYRKLRQQLIKKNEALVSALQMAEESDRMKTEFVRHVSHEIRTPLNAINGFNEILNSSNMEISNEEREDMIVRIKDNTKAITNIVEDMLFLSEKESAFYYAKNDQMLCNQTLSELIYSYRDSVSPNIELVFNTQVSDSFTIVTNQAAVIKIVDHLIKNAIKFTKKGSITLDCQTTNNEEIVKISVTDTGQGVKPETQKLIFEQFMKEDTFKQGMGLGLTVSRKIAQKIGGDLTLDNNYINGARFLLLLPVK